MNFFNRRPASPDDVTPVLRARYLARSSFILLCALIFILAANAVLISFLLQRQITLKQADYGYEALVIVVGIAGLWLLPYRPVRYGVTFRSEVLTMSRTAMIALAGVALIVAARFALAYRGYCQFGFNPVGTVAVTYLLSSFFQEYLFKGVFQTVAADLLEAMNANRVHAAWAAAALFGALHIPFGIPVVAGTTAYGVISGLLYMKTRSIMPFFLMHLVFGHAVFNFSYVFTPTDGSVFNPCIAAGVP